MSRSSHLDAAWLAVGWLLVASVIYLSVTPSPPEIPLEEGDKYGHLVAYGTLMFWFGQSYKGGKRWITVAALVALGIALEFVQRWTGYRSLDVWDMAADAAGVLLGLAAAPPRLPNIRLMTRRLLGIGDVYRP
jgi:VanZ family protein